MVSQALAKTSKFLSLGLVNGDPLEGSSKSTTWHLSSSTIVSKSRLERTTRQTCSAAIEAPYFSLDCTARLTLHCRPSPLPRPSAAVLICVRAIEHVCQALTQNWQELETVTRAPSRDEERSIEVRMVRADEVA